jgi:hypothetical protein
LTSHIKGNKWAEGVREQVLRKTVGARREEVIGRRRKLQNEELRDWCLPLNIIIMSE